jgi:hypothetical protein
MPKSTPKKLAYMAAYQKEPEQEAKRVARNRARRHDLAKGVVHKGDGKDVDHRIPLDVNGSTKDSNTRVVTAAKNRGWRKDNPNMYGKKK